MYSMWLTEEQQQIWRGYLEMVSRLQTAMHRQLQQDCELSLSDYDVLVALSEWGPQRINELGEVLAWEQSRLSHQLRRMRGRGLVARHGSGDDRRGATVDLTDAGRAALTAWLRTEPEPPRLEIEGLVRMFYGDQGDVTDMLRSMQSTQAMARAMLEELHDSVLPERRAAIEDELVRLDAMLIAHWSDSVDLDRASIADRQGIGGATAAAAES